MWQHIRDNARDKGVFLDFVNGYNDHCHCLISLGVDQTLQKVVQMIKEGSAFWINKNNLTSEKFEWQNDYFAVSVSESIVGKVEITSVDKKNIMHTNRLRKSMKNLLRNLSLRNLSEYIANGGMFFLTFVNV